MTSAVGSVHLRSTCSKCNASAIGNPFVFADVTPVIIGLSMTGSTGEENVWGLIVPDQTANFSNITVSQTPNWIQIAA
jgi:hypothetical protein